MRCRSFVFVIDGGFTFGDFLYVRLSDTGTVRAGLQSAH
jgi:hypothetical protein